MRKKPKILVICALERDKRELSRSVFTNEYDIFFHNYYDEEIYEKILCENIGRLDLDVTPEKQIEDIKDVVQEYKPDGIVVSGDYPGSVIASIVAKECNLIGPNPAAVLICQQKYASRIAQREYVPEVTPQFCLLDKVRPFEYPFFIKPVKGFFSFCADVVRNEQELDLFRDISVISDMFMQKFNWFVDQYAPFESIKQSMMAEELLTGVQCTYEGFVKNGKVSTIGVVDSIMFPGTISFARFDYPSSLPELVEKRMHDVAQKLVTGIGLDNALFNIEFMYNQKTDGLYIIEINSRMASQFADLYEKVDGINSYHYAIDVALGKQPQLVKKEGKHAVASSCVLRIFENKKVGTIPTEKQIEQFFKEFPDARYQCYVKEGQRLSDVFQDGKSYRYGLIHLGARDQQELLEKFEHSENILQFELL